MKKLLIIPMLFACYMIMGQAYDFNIKKKLDSAIALRSKMVNNSSLFGNPHLVDTDETTQKEKEAKVCHYCSNKSI